MGLEWISEPPSCQYRPPTGGQPGPRTSRPGEGENTLLSDEPFMKAEPRAEGGAGPRDSSGLCLRSLQVGVVRFCWVCSCCWSHEAVLRFTSQDYADFFILC